MVAVMMILVVKSKGAMMTDIEKMDFLTRLEMQDSLQCIYCMHVPTMELPNLIWKILIIFKLFYRWN